MSTQLLADGQLSVAFLDAFLLKGCIDVKGANMNVYQKVAVSAG